MITHGAHCPSDASRVLQEEEMVDINRRDIMFLSGGATALTSGLLPMKAVSQDATNVDAIAAMHGLEGVTIPKQVSVIGVGGSGCWPALFAALSGVEEILLVDASDVSEDDFGRTFFRPSDVGRPKAEAAADIIRIFRPGVKLNAFKRFVEPEDDDVYFGSVIFDGVDYPPLNEALALNSERLGIVYTQGFYYGLSAGVSNRFLKGVEWTDGGSAPVWPSSAALCGIMQIYSAFAGRISYFGAFSEATTTEDRLEDLLLELPGPAK